MELAAEQGDERRKRESTPRGSGGVLALRLARIVARGDGVLITYSTVLSL
jgi:hypothetical protein